MSMTYFEYVRIVADNIAASAGFLPGVQDAIDAAHDLLDDFEISTPYANWFWQAVAGDLLARRADSLDDHAHNLSLAANEVLKELDSEGPLQ